jgi:hypothetical protein
MTKKKFEHLFLARPSTILVIQKIKDIFLQFHIFGREAAMKKFFFPPFSQKKFASRDVI